MDVRSFEDYYREALTRLNLSLEEDAGLPDDLPADLPAALQAWYRIAGRSWLNAAHNRTFGPMQLRAATDKIVFAEENQDVVVWGYAVDNTAADPAVWQGQAVGRDGAFEWYEENLPLSRFLIEMFRHTVGNAPPAP